MSRLQDVVARLVQAIEAYRRREGDAGCVLKPNPPATPEEIAALEAHLGRTLSPLFREFLLLHNGYDGLAFHGNIMSIADMLPGSKLHERGEEYREDMLKFGNEMFRDAVFFANHDQPNDWGCFYPQEGEWPVALWLTADDLGYDDLIAFFEGRIEQANHVATRAEIDRA